MLLQTLLKKTRFHKSCALTLMATMAAQLLWAPAAKALTSGPVQPEVRGFEPVGTTDMVDPFTGDFVYNIPLLDVEGYPINISYHSGVDMEAEASWVGLGWSLNPGAINKSIRGLPDDFKGEKIDKELYVKPEENVRVGLEAGVEAFCAGEPIVSLSASLGSTLNFSNYRGVSLDFSANLGMNAGMNVGPLGVGVGTNVGATIGSQSGANINYGANMGFGIKVPVNGELNGSFNLNKSGTYNPRTGMRQQSGIGFSIRHSSEITRVTKDGPKNAMTRIGLSTGVQVPIGLENYTAVVSNATRTISQMGRIKLGGTIAWIMPNISVFGSKSTTTFASDGSRPGYGFLYLEGANDSSITDFSREKDGLFNTTLHNLPLSALTYDVYSVNGQGTGGSFRPFRTDIGSVGDPVTKSTGHSESAEGELGIGDLFQIGADVSVEDNESSSGPWALYRRPYGPATPSGLAEKVIFKEAGELTVADESYLSSSGGTQAITPESMTSSVSTIKSSATSRLPRANYIYTLKADENDEPALLDNRSLISFKDTTGFTDYALANSNALKETIERKGTSLFSRKEHHVTEVIQVQKDGRRYVYGLPVVNNAQREVIFALPTGLTQQPKTGTVTFRPGMDDIAHNGNGRDHYYSSTVTPTYTTTHLLTGVLSADYSDLTGDGITDDDLGSFTRFNYSRKSKDYRWRAPLQANKAQYIMGFKSDIRDDKGTYMAGSRENWYMHSIESKNQIAVFYTSRRQDALGVKEGFLPSRFTSPYTDSLLDSSQMYSYKLDSIILYNKHDRILNKGEAQALQGVYFDYDYSLCKGIPNSTDTTQGKLTLIRIRMKSGTSNYNMTAPYKFSYNSLNPDYDVASKDRWGCYKPNESSLNNFEFPFVKQEDEVLNQFAAAWSLTDIQLPSGGQIKVSYEADDYAYVQDKEAMEMFLIKGFGSSPNFVPGSNLYQNTSQPYLYVYFKRRIEAEKPGISLKENYLKGTNLILYNVPVDLRNGRYEDIKGYATVKSINYCNNDSKSPYGYVELEAKALEGNGTPTNPITYTALNLGRYNLSHILFPGSDPDKGTMENIAEGLFNSIKELLSISENPLRRLMGEGAARNVMLGKGFVRLTSPGLCKKGGGLRVKKLEFFDNWQSMSQSAGSAVAYGKEYFYTLGTIGGQGISSGVASYEPSIGSDEIPHHQPVPYQVQAGVSFPPNDPIELYQELPLGESFFPSPVVGYSKVISRSIHQSYARSAQYEDVQTFFTAQDFPVQVSATSINTTPGTPNVSIHGIEIDQQSTQGFSIVLNDMHGKPKSSEHYTLLPVGGQKELNNYVRYEYGASGNTLNNTVPVYEHQVNTGTIGTVNRTVGIEADLTMDSREHIEKSDISTTIGSLNVFGIPLPPFFLPFGLIFPWDKHNKTRFAMASATKIVQQYGVPSKTTVYQEGAVTEQTNEVWDGQTGTALLTSVNNEFKDKEYSLRYPAYWAYKELGPTYKNHNMNGVWPTMSVEDLGAVDASRLVNWRGDQAYPLQATGMPVAKVVVDEGMRDYNLGDEILVYFSSDPIKLWVMGYSSDENHCYLVLAGRTQGALSGLLGTKSNISYRIIRSGQRNRTMENIQSFTTLRREDVLPKIADTLKGLISMQAQTLNHKQQRVSASLESADAINPFISNKIGAPRMEKNIINVKARNYGATTRNAGLFESMPFWKPYANNLPYCYNCSNALVKSFSIARKGQSDSIYLAYNGYVSPPAITIPYYVVEFKTTSGFYSKQVMNFNTATGLSFPNGNTSYGVGRVTEHNFPAGFWTSGETVYIKAYHASDATGTPLNACTLEGKAYLPNSNGDIAIWVYNNAGIIPPTNPYGSQYSTNTYQINNTGNGAAYNVGKKIQFNVLDETLEDAEDWTTLQRSTLYDEEGNELENEDPGIGYNSAVYGYENKLPLTVAKNARYGEALFEGFEDYNLLHAAPATDWLNFVYSPFGILGTFWNATLYAGLPLYNQKIPANGVALSPVAHTGRNSLQPATLLHIPLRSSGSQNAPAGISQKSFNVKPGISYVLRYWVQNSSAVNTVTSLGSIGGLAASVSGPVTIAAIATTGIIEGWQQMEIVFTAPVTGSSCLLKLPAGYRYDDFKLTPEASNSKGFVYHPFTHKLMASLDENNFATFYEYDGSGNLIRTKKETDRGIITLSESRSAHPIR